MASYFALCFVILTISLYFLEFHMWEFFEAWGEAVFLPRKLFPSANCLRCHNSALLKSNCLPKVFFNFCFVCLFSAESERISHIMCIWVTNQYEEGPLVVMNYRRLFYSAKVQIDKWPFPFFRVGLFVIHHCFECDSFSVTLWGSKLYAIFSWKTLTLSRLKAMVPVPSTGVNNRSLRSLGFPDNHRVNAGFQDRLNSQGLFLLQHGTSY